MYARMLIPLDGSKVAEQVLPYARSLTKALTIPVELLGIVDPVPLADFAEVWQALIRGRLLRHDFLESGVGLA